LLPRYVKHGGMVVQAYALRQINASLET
jgi:hypothetical protein